MWRHRANCNHCGQVTRWQRDLDQSLREIFVHLRQAHGLADPRQPADYHIRRERQCDYCLDPYVDRCTKCDRDFCRLHEGDIDGLCGRCI